MKLHPVETTPWIGNGGTGGVVGRGQGVKARRQFGNRIPVAHPHDAVFRQVGEQVGGIQNVQSGTAIFPLLGCFHLAPQLLHHELHAVAHPQNRDPQVPNLGVTHRSGWLIHRVGAPGEDNALRLQLPQLLSRGAIGKDFRIDVGFADAAGNELRVLGSKIENDDHLALHFEGGKAGTGRRCRRDHKTWHSAQ